MTLGQNPPPPRPEPGATPDVPPTDRGKMVLAGVLLMIPIIALMWVPSYAKTDPELFGFPFFFWYQFLWVFLCSGLTWTAYKLTLAARPPRTPRATDGSSTAGGDR
ncbi:DUF3311 domain-containing protein [Nocardioides sp. Soil805]|uniref:DUF3311 domain-containing protein n=1 Tax=Nocardioides sp. Soil805 TaxID=1736416 RepID=UPI001F3DEC65|nr:DUF3311 domain-containing protein [Nocardioides sp. Soil805]